MESENESQSIELDKNSSDEVEKRKSGIKNFFFGWVEDNYDKTFLLVLAVAFLIRFWIFTITLDQALWYDEASYLATAKKWGLGLDVVDIWYYRRGFFWPAFASLFYMVGLGEISIKLSVVLISTGIVASSYFLIKEMFNKKLALLVSTALTFSWLILFFTARPLTEIPSTLLVMISLIFFWKGYVKKQGNKFIYLFALFFALSALTRMQYLTFAPVFLIFIFIKERFNMFKNKALWISLIIFSIVFIPHMILYYQHYGNPVTDILSHYFFIDVSGGSIETTEKITGPPNRIFAYFLDLPYIIRGTQQSGLPSIASQILFLLFLIGIPYFFIDLFLGFDKIFSNEKIQNKLFILLWIIIPLLYLGYVTTDYVEQRYVMPVLPFIFLITIFPLFKSRALLIKNFKLEKSSAVIIISLLIILLMPNLIWGVNLTKSKISSYYEVKQAGIWIKQNSNPNDIVITASHPQIAYYSERSTYIQGNNETEFENKIEELKPRFLILSMFESHPQWLLQYPQSHQGLLKPVHALQQQSQPVLIIYEFDYSNYSNNIP